jgi:type I restriction enzyme, R subunit
VEDLELLKERFEELIKKAIEAILEYFYDSKRREAFYEFYKELADIFDIVSPDKFLRPFLEDYEF